MKRTVLLLVLVAAVMLTAVSQARPPYKEAFDAYYGINVEQPKEQWQQDLKIRVNEARCNICHVPNRPKTDRNEYGSVLEGVLPAYDDPTFRDPVRGPAAYQEIYKAFKTVEPEVGAHRYRFGDLIKNGYLPMYDK